MKVAAILFDGNQKLNGSLFITDTSVDYVLDDFAETSLEFSILYDEIDIVDYFELYDLEVTGIEIVSKDGRRNVFVTEQLIEVKQLIRNKLK